MPVLISFSQVGGGGGGGSIPDERKASSTTQIIARTALVNTTTYYGEITNHYTWQGRKLGKSLRNSQGTITGIGSERSISYDKNGNIKSLSRQGRRSSDTDNVLFDSLSYTYEGNRLKAVYDAITGQKSLGDFPGDGSGMSATFRYDANGNMVSDPIRGLKLSYNQLNMPTTIHYGKGSIENTYAWDGTKRRRVVLDDNYNQISDERYYGDLIVENGQPLRILHADGYVDVSGMPVFNYHLNDHLGNVRAVISSSYGPGAYTQTQASDYYPFGMAHTVEISSVKNGKAMEAAPTAAPRGAQACPPGPALLGSGFWMTDLRKDDESRGNDSMRPLAFQFWVRHCRSQEAGSEKVAG